MHNELDMCDTRPNALIPDIARASEAARQSAAERDTPNKSSGDIDISRSFQRPRERRDVMKRTERPRIRQCAYAAKNRENRARETVASLSSSLRGETEEFSMRGEEKEMRGEDFPRAMSDDISGTRQFPVFHACTRRAQVRASIKASRRKPLNAGKPITCLSKAATAVIKMLNTRKLATEVISERAIVAAASFSVPNLAAAIFRKLISAPASFDSARSFVVSLARHPLLISHLFAGREERDKGTNTCRDGISADPTSHARIFGRFRPVTPNVLKIPTQPKRRENPAASPAVDPLCWPSGDFRVGRKFRGGP